MGLHISYTYLDLSDNIIVRCTYRCGFMPSPLGTINSCRITMLRGNCQEINTVPDFSLQNHLYYFSLMIVLDEYAYSVYLTYLFLYVCWRAHAEEDLS